MVRSHRRSSFLKSNHCGPIAAAPVPVLRRSIICGVFRLPPASRAAIATSTGGTMRRKNAPAVGWSESITDLKEYKARLARNKQIGKPKTQQGQPSSASKAPLTAQFVVNLYEDGTVDSQMTRLCETNFIDVIRAIARGLFEVFERLPF